MARILILGLESPLAEELNHVLEELGQTVRTAAGSSPLHAADADLVFAAATLGQLYRSTDGGESWVSLPQRLSEIRALLWLPD